MSMDHSLCVSLRKTLRPLRLIFLKFLDCVKSFHPFSTFDVQCSMFDVQSLKLARRAISSFTPTAILQGLCK
jgi:hypothetical protein